MWSLQEIKWHPGSLYSIPQDKITHSSLCEMRVLTHMSQEECFWIEVDSLGSRACSSAYLLYKPKFSRRPTPDLSTKILFSTTALNKPFFSGSISHWHPALVPPASFAPQKDAHLSVHMGITWVQCLMCAGLCPGPL